MAWRLWLRLHRLPIVAIVVAMLGIALLARVPLFMLLALLSLLRFVLGLTLGLLALRLPQKPQVVLGMLLEVFSRNAVAGQLAVSCKALVFLDDLGRRPAHPTLGPGTVKNAVDYIAHVAVAVVVILVARTAFV